MEDVSTDPETYLRLACEHVVLTHDRDKGYPPGADAAAVGRAFIAAKILEEGKVRSVLDEYAFAITLRLPGGDSGGNWRYYRHMQRIFDGVTLSSVRAVACHIPIGGTDNSRTLDWVHFGENHTRLDLFGTSDPDQLGVNGGVAHFRRDAGGHLRSDSLTVKDDQGTTAYAHRSGGSWTETNWELQYSTSVALSADSQWLEIDGYRVDLPTRGPQLEVKVEALEDTDPIRSMLYREVLEHPSQPGANPMVAGVIEALIATGALRSDDPLVGETELIVRSLASRAALPDLPELWASLSRRFSKTDGPVGTVPIGASVAIEGFSIRFDFLVSEKDSFSIAFGVSPGSAFNTGFSGFELNRSPLLWWAEDDRNNAYICTASSGISGMVAEGQIRSRTPIDPEAKELRLLPTGMHSRAVIVVPVGELRGSER